MARLGFDCMNNMAEYEACALRIQAVIDFNIKLLKVYGDSTLVIHQLRGEWETRDHKLIPYQAYIKKLTEFFDDISFHHIPKEKKSNGRCVRHSSIHVPADSARRLAIHRVQMSRQARALLFGRRGTGW